MGRGRNVFPHDILSEHLRGSVWPCPQERALIARVATRCPLPCSFPSCPQPHHPNQPAKPKRGGKDSSPRQLRCHLHPLLLVPPTRPEKRYTRSSWASAPTRGADQLHNPGSRMPLTRVSNPPSPHRRLTPSSPPLHHPDQPIACVASLPELAQCLSTTSWSAPGLLRVPSSPLPSTTRPSASSWSSAQRSPRMNPSRG